jgi:hypothetical protein
MDFKVFLCFLTFKLTNFVACKFWHAMIFLMIEANRNILDF